MHRSMHSSVSRGLGLPLVFLCCAVFFTGCDGWRWLRGGEKPPPPDPTTQPEPVQSSADSTEAPPWEWEALGDTALVKSLGEPDQGAPVPPPPSSEEESPSPEPERSDVVPPPPTSQSDSSEGEEFMVELPPAEKAALLQQTERDLGAALAILKAWGGSEVADPAVRSRLQTVEDYLAQTRAKLDIDDVQSAAALAHKARLLAEEIGRP